MKRKLLIGSIISAVFLYLAFRGIEWSVLLEVIKRTRIEYLIPAVASTVVQLYLRSYRWKFMLLPIKSIPTSHLFSATSIGYMANNILPARLGELVRAYVLGKQENISRTASFATIVYERVIDVFALVAMVWLLLLKASGPAWLLKAGWWLLGLNLACLVLMVLMERNREASARVLEKIIRPLPATMQTRILYLFTAFLTGLQCVSSARTQFSMLLTSLLVWGSTLAGVYFCFGALDLKVPLIATITVQVLVALGTMIPSAPAYVGTTQYACMVALGLYGIDKSEALAYSLLFHATIFVPVTLIGFFFLWRSQVRFDELSQQR